MYYSFLASILCLSFNSFYSLDSFSNTLTLSCLSFASLIALSLYSFKLMLTVTLSTCFYSLIMLTLSFFSFSIFSFASLYLSLTL
jgi:hypothetical protein